MPNSLKGTGLDQSNLGPNIAGTGPAFSVRRVATQSVGTNADVKVLLNSKDFDTSDAFDAVTNHRFQPNVAGFYLITYSVYGLSAGSTNLVLAHLRGKNGAFGGSIQSHGAYVFGGGTTFVDSTSAGAELVQLNGVDDYVELWARVNGAGACSVDKCKLQGFLARAA